MNFTCVVHIYLFYVIYFKIYLKLLYILPNYIRVLLNDPNNSIESFRKSNTQVLLATY